jgi:hypothetical protein
MRARNGRGSNPLRRIMGTSMQRKTSRGFEPRSLDSESRVLTVTPRGPGIADTACNRKPAHDPQNACKKPAGRGTPTTHHAHPVKRETPRGVGPRPLDSEYIVPTATPRGRLRNTAGPRHLHTAIAQHVQPTTGTVAPPRNGGTCGSSAVGSA